MVGHGGPGTRCDAPAMVAPGATRPPRGAPQRGHRPRLPLRLLRRPAPGRLPPGRGHRPGPHPPRLPGPRRAPRARRPDRVRPADPRHAAGRRTPAAAAVPHQPLDPLAQPRRAGRDGAGRGPRVPAADPVGCGPLGRRLRPRHPGHRLGRRAQRPLLAGPGGLPGHPRLPRSRFSSGRRLGLVARAGGRGGGRRAGLALRRGHVPRDPRPGPGPHHPRAHRSAAPLRRPRAGGRVLRGDRPPVR